MEDETHGVILLKAAAWLLWGLFVVLVTPFCAILIAPWCKPAQYDIFGAESMAIVDKNFWDPCFAWRPIRDRFSGKVYWLVPIERRFQWYGWDSGDFMYRRRHK